VSVYDERKRERERERGGERERESVYLYKLMCIINNSELVNHKPCDPQLNVIKPQIFCFGMLKM